MKACVLHAKGDLRYEEYPDPVMTEDCEVMVRVLRGGICGSDMHYYQDGGIGELIRVREPIIIGHEGIGVVEQVGTAVSRAKVGDTVAIRPARPCFHCMYCLKEQYTYCLNMRHLGSAATYPHVNGLFADKVLLHEQQVRPVVGMDPKIGAFAEPLAVAYNGVRSLGEIIGKNLLVMGTGPIGSLCIAVAKLLGADSVTAVDVRDEPLEVAKKMGADVVCNSRANPDQVAAWKENRGAFDIFLDASGNGFAIADGMAMTRPEGTVSQVGMIGAHVPKDLGVFSTKGLKWVGVQRFYKEFPAAVHALEAGLIDPLPLYSGEFPAEKCDAAMQAAISPETSKVQVVISE